MCCPSKNRQMLREAGILEIQHWIQTNSGINECTSQLLKFLLDIINLPTYHCSRRGLWVGLPQHRILTEAQDYLTTTATWKAHKQKINTGALIQFHIALLKHATNLWKLRCTECNATDAQREAMMKLTNVVTLREFMAESIKSSSRNYNGPRQTIIRKWLDCSRTPICIPRSRTPLTLKRHPPGQLEEPLTTPQKRQKLLMDLDDGNPQEIQYNGNKKRKAPSGKQTLYYYFKPITSERSDEQGKKRSCRRSNKRVRYKKLS